MPNDAPDRLVSTAALEARLGELAANAAGAREGVFGPRSMRWHVDREAALFLGAGRALLLQLAHPWVAAAVAQHSRALDDPIGRFHGTFGTVFAMVFGTLEDALATARRLHQRHSGITGRLADGGTYHANERSALRWVHATLTDTALAAYQLVLPLGTDDRARYYADSVRFAALFGLDANELPPAWDAFADDFLSTLRSDMLVVSDQARAIAARLLAGAGSRVIVPAWYRALTAELLPPHLRDGFGLSFGPAEAAAAARARRRLRLVYPRLPARLRFVGPYFEAKERLAGRATPSAATRLGNRFWIGRSRLGG